MVKYSIAWLEGDGIGKDVMECARIVLDAIDLDAEYIKGDVGWEFWCTEGDPLPKRTIDLLKRTDCCLFGAITSKPKEEAEKELDPALRGQGFEYRSPIVRLRQLLELRTNMRPCKAYEGNPLNLKEGIDIVVFRENTEDLYSGVEFHPVPEEVFDSLNANNPRMARFKDTPLGDMAISLRINTRKGCRNIIKDAFEHAKRFGYGTVTVVEKPNVIRETSGLMVREARNIAKDYPGIELWETNIDAMAMWLVKNPGDYGVLVSTNLFGDIISDLAAQLVGGLGFSPSANIGDDYALFEPTHGSAPKYEGTFISNPIAMLLTTKLMLDHLKEEGKAKALETAVSQVIKEGRIRTYDMEMRKADMDKDGGKAMELAKEVASKVGSML